MDSEKKRKVHQNSVTQREDWQGRLSRLLLLPQRLAGAHFQHIEQQRVSPERFGEEETHGREARCESIARRGQVLDDVLARGKEIREQNHIRGFGLHTECAAGLDVRFSQFQERHLNDGVIPSRAQSHCDKLEIGIRLRSAAPVRDQ